MSTLMAAIAGALCGVSAIAFFVGLLLGNGKWTTAGVGGFLGGLALYVLAGQDSWAG